MQELELLFKVAQLYYEQGLTQNEIAKKLYISRSNISRLLTQAREAGIHGNNKTGSHLSEHPVK